MKLTLTHAWLNAAALEAGRVGAATIDLDHLYLGLLGVGGAAARLLGRHGVSLTSARARVRDLLAADLAGLGVGEAATLLPEPLTQPADCFPVDLSDRARPLVAASGKSPDTFALLLLLLQEPSGVVRRLVHADGILPQDLAAPLKEGSDEPYATDKATLLPGVLPRPAFARSVTHFVAASPDHVLAVLGDPAVLPLVGPGDDPDQDPTTADGIVLSSRGGHRSMRVRAALRPDADGSGLTWVWELLDTAWSGQNLTYHQFVANPAPGGTDLTHTLGYRTFGTVGRLMEPFTRRLAGGAGLMHQRYALAAHIAETDA